MSQGIPENRVPVIEIIGVRKIYDLGETTVRALD